MNGPQPQADPSRPGPIPYVQTSPPQTWTPSHANMVLGSARPKTRAQPGKPARTCSA